MLEIDQCINSQRILDTGCYQTKNARLSEDRWLAKYMMQQGASTDEICSKIEELYCSRLDYKPT